MARQPIFYIPHGGGPCFFMDDPLRAWEGMEVFLQSLAGRLAQKPAAILLISAHWETDGFAFTGASDPGLVYDYYGFPPHTYDLKYNAPGCLALAAQAVALLEAVGLKARIDEARGLDHGAFIPLKVAFPDADIPVVEMSLDSSLDPALHLKAGQALAGLSDQNILIIASGMSSHNMRGYRDPGFAVPSQQFDDWLSASMALAPEERAARLARWLTDAPFARLVHPREEHLVPALIAAGAATSCGAHVYSEMVLCTAVSGFHFS